MSEPPMTEAEQLVEEEYQKYRKRKRGLKSAGSETKILMTSGSSHKENLRVNQSPQSISFGKIRSHNKTIQQQKRLLDLLACDTYSAAESKINDVNSASQLLLGIEDMMVQVRPEERHTRQSSWRFIKKAVMFYTQSQQTGSPVSYMRSP